MRVDVEYVATDRLLQLMFSFELGGARENTVWLDQVSVFPVAGSPGSQQGLTTVSLLPVAGTTLVTALRAASSAAAE